MHRPRSSLRFLLALTVLSGLLFSLFSPFLPSVTSQVETPRDERKGTPRPGFRQFTLISVALLAFAGGGVAYDETKSKRIEGVYELVSQETRLTKPSPKVYALSPPQWKGLWLIQNGHFSSVLSRTERKGFFDSKERDLGYESFAGIYEVKGNEIVFTQTLSLHPFYEGRPVVMKYTMKNNTLTLTQALHPTVEDLSEGEITIILRKISKGGSPHKN
jgi:hypothetical protein